MTKSTDREREVLDQENKYWNAMVAGDWEATLELTANPCIVTGAQGAAKLDHESFRKMSQSDNSWKLHSFELSDTNVEFITDDVAVVGYRVKEEMTVDGKPLTLECIDASTWVKRDGKWVCAMHSESIKGDPFGRAMAVEKSGGGGVVKGGGGNGNIGGSSGANGSRGAGDVGSGGGAGGSLATSVKRGSDPSPQEA